MYVSVRCYYPDKQSSIGAIPISGSHKSVGMELHMCSEICELHLVTILLQFGYNCWLQFVNSMYDNQELLGVSI